jgi:CheY-like chemotaxis protein
MRQLTRLMIVDDELHDIGFMMQFFQEALSQCTIETFATAEQALARLNFENERGDNPSLTEDPDIIILDLALGAMDGFEFLKVLRKDETLRQIPVVVISGDDRPQAIDRAYEAGANAMFKKPSSLQDYRSMIGSIVDYWQKTARHAAA